MSGACMTWNSRCCRMDYDSAPPTRAPDETMAASTIMWLDEANKTAEFEPVGTHPDHRRLGLGKAMLLHGMHLAREAGANHMTVACLSAPGHPRARGLYYSVGFRKFTQDVPLIKTKA
jgi:GNAT superfamily N-acetyltransferase